MEVRHTIMTTRTNVTMGIGGINIRLRVARITSGKTVAEISEEVGLDPSTIYKYENARIDYPAPNRLQAIAEVTGVSFYWLLSGIGEPTTDSERNEVVRYWMQSIAEAAKGAIPKR